MGILLVLVLLIVISALAMAGRVADSRKDTGRFDWDAPFTAGRDPTLHPRHS